MSIQPNSKVLLQLTMVDPEGDEHREEEPVEIELGRGFLPMRLEEELVGKGPGSQVEVDCPPGEVFGDHDPEAIVSVPRDQFDDDVDLSKGALIHIEVEEDDGEVDDMDAVVVEANAEAVILDVNHPLAGKAVTLRAEIVEIR